EKALFKLGWVYYNLDRFDDAKTVLADLLDREVRKVEREGREFAPAPILFFPGPRRGVQKNPEPKGSDLYQETLEIIARVYSESGGADGLVRFIRSRQRGGKPQPYAAPLMHRLALVEKERSQFDAAARAYELLLGTFPTFRDAPKIELEYVQVLIDQKQLERAAKAREVMLEKYDSGSPWARANPEEEIRDAALRAARKGLSWSIRYYHSRGLEQQKESGGVPQDLRHAIALYEKYLRRFPEGKASYDRRFRHAQALFAAAEYERAGEAFRFVSFDEAFDHRRDEAAFARILSVEKLAESRPRPLPATVTETLVAAYEDYIQLNPQSDKNPALLFKEGQLYFEAATYAPAIAAFTRLIDAYGASPFAAEAHDLIAQAHFRLEEYPVAERWAELALGQARSGDALGARRGEVENLYALTIFRQGEKADEEKRYDEATKHYLRLVDRLPANETAPRALYNAAVAIENSGRPEEAARLFERLLSDYVESD
ncbi:MAG: tetratricopeptide repeat protein, partial [Candidatus Binatia bacterium]